MCGITGYLGFNGAHSGTLAAMITAMQHRGPDAQGQWFDEASEIALGHARLSIVDLSEAGAQPMTSASGRYLMVYNGEIYNHQDIRQELESAADGLAWRGFSDSETLLAGFDHWGVEQTLHKSIGMFGIAIWDHADKTLTLVRDRFGEKPLYYQPSAQGVIFSSELASLRQHPLCSQEMSTAAVAQLVELDCVPAPLSIYEGVYKLLPGTSITFNHTGFVSTKQWWSPFVTAMANKDTWQGSEEEALLELEQRLGDSVERQMLADVPLGAFLSGGIDSSLIVALMQKCSATPVKTYTIGFEQQQFDEAQYARKVAQHLGTEHHEHYVSDQEIIDLVPGISAIYSEPFADSSQLPTYLVSKVARQGVTVALSGDAGDEIFSGYNRHTFTHNHWNTIQKVPHALRKMAAAAVQLPSESQLDKMFGLLPMTSQWTRIGEKLKRSSHAVSARSVQELYQQFTRAAFTEQLLQPDVAGTEQLGPQADLTNTATAFSDKCASTLDAMRWMMIKDQTDYLPNDILAKVDRAAMACSLETRAPFLDHTLVEFTQKLPGSMLVDGNKGKSMLRKILHKHIPDELFERPKMGFSIPVSDMLKGPLRDWAEALLDAQAIGKGGAFDADVVARLWSEHLAGKQDHILKLWPVLMFQAWKISH